MDYITKKQSRLRDYHNNKKFGGIKYDVLQRDNFRCVVCGISEREHVELFNRELSIHHKDEIKKHNTLNNLITVCGNCHTIIHHGRKHVFYGNIIMAERNKGRTFQSIANELGISRQRVHQIYKKLTY